MNRKIDRLTKMIGVTVFVVLVNPSFGALSIMPSRIEGKIPPGKSYENEFTITNTDSQTNMAKFMWTDRTKKPADKNWFRILTKEAKIPAGGTVKVKYKIDIPEGAQGEYNAYFTVEDGKPVGNVMGASVALRTSVPVYIAVRGTEKYSFEIGDITVANGNMPMVKVILRNTGNIHIRPEGKIMIKKEGSDESFELPFNDIKWGIIEGEQNDYITKLPKDKKFTDGQYTASLSIEAGEEDNIVKQSKEFRFTVQGTKASLLK